MDHGVLNLPLASRGNIDAQIDKFKAKQSAEKVAARKASASEAASDRAEAKALVKAATAERIAELATRMGVTSSAMKKRLASDAHWQPKLIKSILSK